MRNRLGKRFFETADKEEAAYWRLAAAEADRHPHHKLYQSRAWMYRLILPLILFLAGLTAGGYILAQLILMMSR